MADTENQKTEEELDRLLKTRTIEAKIEELRKTIATIEARISELDDEIPF
jgi:prefoldin subunit 5